MNIKEVLEKCGNGVLTEESVKMITEAFDSAVNTRVNERVELEVAAAVEKLDAEHMKKFTSMLEKYEKTLSTIDERQAEAIKLTVERVSENIKQDCFEKLRKVVASTGKLLNEDSAVFKEELRKKIANFLDIHLEKAIPKKQITEAMQYKRAHLTLEKIKENIVLDDAKINKTFAESIQDGKKTIDEFKKQLNEAIKQNITLSQELSETKTSLFLEENTKGLTKEKRDYVIRSLKNKPYESIKDNFNFVMEMFDREQEEEREVLAEEAKKASKVLSNKVDSPKVSKSNVISESTKFGTMDSYLEGLKQISRKS